MFYQKAPPTETTFRISLNVCVSSEVRINHHAQGSWEFTDITAVNKQHRKRRKDMRWRFAMSLHVRPSTHKSCIPLSILQVSTTFCESDLIIDGSLQAQIGWSFDQPWLVKKAPSHGRRAGTRWPVKFLSTQCILLILWFYGLPFAIMPQ